jgi:lysophospholipid acyltransferase (LPLAT)-like uncharacterized protein
VTEARTGEADTSEQSFSNSGSDSGSNSGSDFGSDSGSGPRRFSLSQRLALGAISWLGYWLIRAIGSTLRVSISFEDGAQQTVQQRPLVASFWHSCIIPSAYVFRGMGFRVMTSASFDGEYIARIIQKFGFVAVRGSSNHNAVSGLLGLRRAIEESWTVVFTIDGPRGPRRQVKPGPIGLARATGVPLTMFHAAIDKAWILNSWDRLMIPAPFSRVLVRFGKLIPVPPEASDEQLGRYMVELQSALDRVCEFAEANVKKVGTIEFPCGNSR